MFGEINFMWAVLILILAMAAVILIVVLSTQALVADVAAEKESAQQDYADAFAEIYLNALAVADSHNNHEIYSDLVTVFGGYDALLKVADDHHRAHLLRNKAAEGGK